VRDLVKGVPDLTAGLPEAFLNVPRRLICDAFVAQLLVVGGLAHRFLDVSLQPIDLAVKLVLVHKASSLQALQEPVRQPYRANQAQSAGAVDSHAGNAVEGNSMSRVASTFVCSCCCRATASFRSVVRACEGDD
jgi:hypothetical protein